VEVELVGQIKIEARVAVGIDERGVDIDEGASGRGGAVGADERVVVIQFPISSSFLSVNPVSYQ